tara:strand:+ start:132 stop:950 length:819 start_codon:yes stop_codon:yes gene_type:complete
MAKKSKEKEVSLEEAPVTVKEKPTVKKQEPKKDSWEIKDRMYYLRNDLTPLTYTVRSRGIFWFDQEKGYERELKYTVNQRTPFVDEFKGEARLGHIIFEDGALWVPRDKQVLQKLLSLYHPDRNKLFHEHNPVQEATDDLVSIEMEIEALNVARDIDIDLAEAVLRVEQGTSVNELTSKELKRDVILYAKNNPKLFLELVNDENVQLRNFGIKAVEAGYLKLSSDNRVFMWKDTQRKVMTVPFDEHPYSALASWFKTDEGLEVYKNLEKRLK